MDFTVKGQVTFRSVRGAYSILVKDEEGNEYGTTINYPQLGAPLRSLEQSWLRTKPAAPKAPERVEIEEPPIRQGKSTGFVMRIYDLTTNFHKLTKQKVVMSDLYDAFFVTGIKDVEEDDQPAFEARLRKRLEEQSPGWEAI